MKRGSRGRGKWSNRNQPCQVPARAYSSVLSNTEATSSAENPKFKEACQRIQSNIENHLNDNYNCSSSSSEDELEDCAIIQKTFQKYTGDGHGDSQKARDQLQESLTSGAVVCLICIESVKRNDPVWSCHRCYCMLHVTCIQKWAKDSIFHQSCNDDPGKQKVPDKKWYCPKCRHEYDAVDTPSRYFCFCGKVEDPALDPWIIPHSCGQTCEKELQPPCGHRCLLLCHPGSCPPCPITVEVTCHCGKSRPVTKRCSGKHWSCGRPCNKLLACNQHRCPMPCHDGECDLCSLQSQQKCVCGLETQLRPCSDLTWKCLKKCSKRLSCGNHCCEITCHDGPCPSCPKSGPRPCPCGKKTASLPCTEEITPCGDTCDKTLECEIHRCVQRCHYDKCGSCLQMRTMRCRCGQREKSVPCCKEFLCDIKCKNKRDCRKHNCNRKCCIGNCPPCEASCGKTLNCGSHKCQSRCHPGPCFPCKETVEIRCNCKNTKITIPCGRKRSAIPPQCNADCKLPADCHHEQRQRHRCHFGDCPPCRLTCNKVHLCGHPCPSKCHNAVLTKVEVKKKREGPWDLPDAFRMQLLEIPCPPCNVPISLSCLGKHVVHDFQCHEVRPWSCGRHCGRQLICGNHTCDIQCHEVEDDLTATQQSVKCESCTRACERDRPQECSHACRKPCHPGDCAACKEMTKMRCHCHINMLYIVCSEWTNADDAEREKLLCCNNTCPHQLSCGHRCPKICHKGPCPDRNSCKKKTTVRCLCKRLKKDLPCIAMVDKLECNEGCFENLEKIRALQEAKNKAELQDAEKKREQELEEFRRKTEGRKKKTKKLKEVLQEKNFFQRNWFSIVSCVLSILISYLIYAYKVYNR